MAALCPHGPPCQQLGLTGSTKKPVSAQEQATTEPPRTNYLKIDAWEVELDQSFEFFEDVMDGIRYGFPLINKTVDNVRVERDNYQSATNPTARPAVEAQICEELSEGRYRIVDTKPQIISSLGAIPKTKDKVRLIHDASQPEIGSLNSYAELDEKASYESVQDAASMLEEGFYMAKVDLKGAYRSVRILPEHQTLAGLKWKSGKGSVHG